MASEARRPVQTMRPAVEKTYGPDDLSAVPVFAGGFINFGYWRGIGLDGSLSHDDRVRSQQDLYRHVLDTAGAVEGRRVLEVGCGLGIGCALALEEYGPEHVTGMDIHPQQLQRARQANARLLDARPQRLAFVQGAAEDLPFGDGEFDCLYSVEAAQHFPDLTAFAREAARVLRPGGRAVIASFFTVDDAPERAERLAELLDSYASGLDIARPAAGLTDALTGAGLTRVRAASIGPDVWEGWDRWLARLWQPGTWPRNFLRAYREGVLDYYVISADQPPS